jgi:hypothetical protein
VLRFRGICRFQISRQDVKHDDKLRVYHKLSRCAMFQCFVNG